MTARSIASLAPDMRDTLRASSEPDSLERARFRLKIIIAGLYDEEPTDPEQAIRDLLTDVLHEADARGIDVHHALDRATWMRDQEVAEWKVRDA